MVSLRNIQHTVQQTAIALKDVLKIDVEVVDDQMVLVASTSHDQEKCGQVMVEGFVYQHVLQTGSTVVIENPGDHALCEPCPRRGQCEEDAEMAAPILYAGRPVGVIGLVSFDPEQTSRLLENRAWMLRFVEKMAELIASGLTDGMGMREEDPAWNLGELEREMILKALSEVAGQSRSKDRAAEMLGISRATLYRKIKEYKIG